MKSRAHALRILAVIGVATLLTILGGDAAVSMVWVRLLAWLIAAALGAWALFDLRLWRLRPIHRAWVRRPNLRGTWRATLKSNWTDPTSGKPLDAIEGYMVVEQTFQNLRLRFLTTESESTVLGASVLPTGGDSFRVVAIYRSEPRADGRRHGEAHCGTLMLDSRGRRPRKLMGRYLTDRDTSGEISLLERRSRLAEDFAGAARLFRKAA